MRKMNEANLREASKKATSMLDYGAVSADFPIDGFHYIITSDPSAVSNPIEVIEMRGESFFIGQPNEI